MMWLSLNIIDGYSLVLKNGLKISSLPTLRRSAAMDKVTPRALARGGSLVAD